MARPVFQNEIIDSYNGVNAPQYLIVGDSAINGATLELLNPISQPGTPHNADTMNNLFNFENLASMRGNTRKTVFNVDGSVTESISDSALGTVNATRVTTFPGGGVTEAVTVYDDMGTVVLRQTTQTTSFNPDGSVSEVIT